MRKQLPAGTNDEQRTAGLCLLVLSAVCSSARVVPPPRAPASARRMTHDGCVAAQQPPPVKDGSIQQENRGSEWTGALGAIDSSYSRARVCCFFVVWAQFLLLGARSTELALLLARVGGLVEVFFHFPNRTWV